MITRDDILKALEQEEWWQLAEGQHDQISGTMGLRYQGYCLRLVMYCANNRLDTYTITVPKYEQLKWTWPGYIPQSITSKVLKRLVEYVRNLYEKFTEVIDVEIEKQEKEKARKQRAVARRQQIVNTFPVPLRWNKFNEFECELIFQMTADYALHFEYRNGDIDPNEPIKFHELALVGDFTQAEVEKLIEWLASTPSAVADRVLEGKG